MLPIKAEIIDDESSAIKLLEEIVNNIEGVKVNGSAQDIEKGINLVLQHRPILFSWIYE